MSLAFFTPHDNFQFQPLPCRWHNFGFGSWVMHTTSFPPVHSQMGTGADFLAWQLWSCHSKYGVHASLCHADFWVFGHTQECPTRWYSNSSSWVFKNPFPDSHCGCINFLSPQDCIRVLFSPPLHSLVLLFISELLTTMKVRWNLSVVSGFVFPWWLRVSGIFSCTYWSFVLLLRTMVH